MAGAKKETKQAVVVIHGMGEQLPMGTLRSFVEAVWETDRTLTGASFNPWWIKPDKRAGLQELRRITTMPIDIPSNRNSVKTARANGKRTDFYEFYWADIMQGTTWQHFTSWVTGLLFRLPSNVPWNVIQIWAVLWILFLAGVLYLILRSGNVFDQMVDYCGTLEQTPEHFGCYVITRFVSWEPFFDGVVIPLATLLALAVAGWWLVWKFLLSSQMSWIRTTLALLLLLAAGVVLHPFVVGAVHAVGVFALVTPVLAVVIHQFLVSYFGDVARYVKASPDNVAKRREVRNRGLALLKGLNASPDYDRIVIVSHSLGTIIAYDLINLLWADIGPSRTNGISSEARKLMNEMNEMLEKSLQDPPQPLDPQAYRDLQRRIVEALSTDYSRKDRAEAAVHDGMTVDEVVQASMGRWLISDLVTVGSPLTHAEFLLANDISQLDDLIEERILPTNPPALEQKLAKKGNKSGSKASFLFGGGPRSNYPHHASCFSAVRWTNIYDKSRVFFCGDPISGPVSEHFGVPRIISNRFGKGAPGDRQIGRPAGTIRDIRVKIHRTWIWPFKRIFTHTQYWAWPYAGHSPEPSDEEARPMFDFDPLHPPKRLRRAMPEYIDQLRRAVNLLDRDEAENWK